MPFKHAPTHFQEIDLSLIQPAPHHVRRQFEEAGLKRLANSIQRVGVIQPLIVRPADASGRHTLVVGERRRRAAQLAGEARVPVLVRACDDSEALEVQVFENIGLGVRAPLEPRDMAKALQRIAERFETPEEAARYFDRAPTWLNQATAPAKLSEPVNSLLEAGKIGSTGAAVQLEKLAQKDEAKARALIEQIAQLPEGEKVSRKRVDHALSEAIGRRRKADESDATPPWETPSNAPSLGRITPDKVKRVAEILGISDANEARIIECLIDAFLAQQDDAATEASS